MPGNTELHIAGAEISIYFCSCVWNIKHVSCFILINIKYVITTFDQMQFRFILLHWQVELSLNL